MKNINQIKDALAALFEQQYFAVLATHSGAGIHTSLVAFAAADHLRTLFLCTPRATRKYANIIGNPEVSLLMHDSTNQADDIRQALAVSVSGTATEAVADQLAPAQKRFLAKHPHLDHFVKTPDTAMIQIRVARYDVVARFQDVTILEIQNDRIALLS